ncbi:hypothetical protein GW17_00019424, partial [Ensete ventricosum]
PFLVESNSDDPTVHSILNRIIMPKSIGKHGRNWKNVDYLVFNTYIWWLNTPTMKVLQSNEIDCSRVIRLPARAVHELLTWGPFPWFPPPTAAIQTSAPLDADRCSICRKRGTIHVDLSTPKLHYRYNNILFPVLFACRLPPRSTDWDDPDGIKCALETQPVANLSHPLHVGTDWRLFAVAEEVISSSSSISSMRRVPVSFVKITAMSEYRKDAHTSVHTLRQGKLLTAEQQADPATYADCIHWCLPGLPDTWNEFLFARIASSPWRDH